MGVDLCERRRSDVNFLLDRYAKPTYTSPDKEGLVAEFTATVKKWGALREHLDSLPGNQMIDWSQKLRQFDLETQHHDEDKP